MKKEIYRLINKDTEAYRFILSHAQECLGTRDKLFDMGLRKQSVPNYSKGSVYTYEALMYYTLILEMLERGINTNMQSFNILEIGTGTGYFSLVLAHMMQTLDNSDNSSAKKIKKKIKINVTSIDIEPERTERAKKLLEMFGLLGYVNFRVVDSKLFFKENKEKYNFILIDGSHTYEDFSKDLESAIASVDLLNTPFCIVCDDAYETPADYLGIFDGISECTFIKFNPQMCFFLDSEIFDLHSYDEDKAEAERLELKWESRNYRCWSSDADPKKGSFGITNLYKFPPNPIIKGSK